MRSTVSWVQLMQNAFLHCVEHDLLAGHIQLDAQHQAEAADFLDETKMLGEIGEAHAEIAADVDDLREQFVEDVEEFEGDAAGERSAAEGGSVHAAADRGRGAFIGGDHAQRNAAGHRFGGHHDVGQHGRFEHLIREVGSGAADAALDLVEDEQGVVAIGQLARGADVLGGERDKFRLRPGPVQE